MPSVDTSDDEGDISDVSEDPVPVQYTLPTTSSFNPDDYKSVSTKFAEGIEMFPLMYKKLIQAIDKLQKENKVLRQHNDELRNDKSDLKSQLALAKRAAKGKKGGAAATHDELLNHELIVKLGKMYAVMVEPWAHLEAFGQWPAKDAPRANSKQRFASREAYIQGAVVELHKFLGDPVLCKRAAEYPPFKTAVSAHIFAIHGYNVFTITFQVSCPDKA